jgi:dTDP-4-amino-4,6-dideoxygalactose transaminase
MNKTFVTKTALPNLAEYQNMLEGIWDRVQLTNEGPLVLQLQENLKEHLKVSNVQLVTNGTVALQLAIQGMQLKGEIITTPYSYVATLNSIIWQHCKPVFVDIEEDSFGIDPSKIESAISNKTAGIVATHVYGLPCKVNELEAIASKHNLALIFDAAQCFGVKLNGESIFNFGDIATASFHATKVFHTVEGGAVFTKSAILDEKIRTSKTFGHIGDDHLLSGINGKMSELHAAMGICNIKLVDFWIKERRQRWEKYRENLKGSGLKTLQIPDNVEYNYAYFPVFFEHFEQMNSVLNILQEDSIFPRRYFYPSLNTVPFVDNQECPVSEDLANRVLCLPLHPALDHNLIDYISDVLIKSEQKAQRA